MRWGEVRSMSRLWVRRLSGILSNRVTSGLLALALCGTIAQPASANPSSTSNKKTHTTSKSTHSTKKPAAKTKRATTPHEATSHKPPAPAHVKAKIIKGAKAGSLHSNEDIHLTSTYRGWDFLVGRLRATGVSSTELNRIYRDPQMPWFNFIPFSLKPRESHSLYAGFRDRSFYRLGANFIRLHRREFDHMERTLHVPSEVVAAILAVESRFGKNTGDHMIVYRLSRLAAVGDPENLVRNFERLRLEDPTVRMEDVRARAAYLEETFLPELPALIEIGRRNRINILHVRGSIAGAFGMPQFLPSAFLRFGYDGNRDGIVSLHNEVDALWSTANYLGTFGYRENLPTEEKRAIIWRYNKSDAYIDTILSVSRGIRGELY